MPSDRSSVTNASLPALETRSLSVWLGSRRVLNGVSLSVPQGRMVALIGPAGCGKSTLLASLNRMVELRPGARIDGEVRLRGQDIYAPEVDPVQVRRRIGMIPQNPSLFPLSVFENVAFGPRMAGFKGDLTGLVEESLKRTGLWDEVGERLYDPARFLPSGQRLRLCIARALAVGPEVLLMDEPMSTLDPGASQRIEGLIDGLRSDLTIVMVTNNMQRAARISDLTVFLMDGEVVEYGPTDRIFTNPREERTEAYVTGRYG